METGHDSLESIRRRIGERTIRKLADDALAFQGIYAPPHHIWQALKAYERDDRSALFAAVKQELALRAQKERAAEVIHRREEDAALQGSHEEDAALRRAHAERLLQDAEKHEQSQPEDAYRTSE